MSTVSSSIAERARKFASIALQRISAVGQNTIAAEIGVSPPTISRFVSDDLERACQVLAAAGLKVVANDRVCVDPHMYEAMHRIATKAMSDAEIAQKLVWED
jgi:hypothetical protein